MERCNWLVRRFSEDPFGDALIKAGLTEKTLRAWSADPQLFPPSAAPDEKVKASLFGASWASRMPQRRSVVSLWACVHQICWRTSTRRNASRSARCVSQCCRYPRLSRLIGLVFGQAIARRNPVATDSKK